MAQNVGARSTSPTGRVTAAGVAPLDGAGRQISGSRIRPSTWYGPLNNRPKSPCSSPWSVVTTTSTSSPHPRAAIAREHATDGLVDQLALDRVAGVDLAHLVGGQRRRDPVVRRLVVGHERAVVPRPPVARLGVEHGLAGGGVGDVAVRERHVAPVDAVELGGRRIPRVVRVREAHPAEPVVVGGQRLQPGDGAVGDPVGVVPPAGDRVVVDLRRAGRPAAGGVDLQRAVEHRVEHPDRLRVRRPPASGRSAAARRRCGWPPRSARTRGAARPSRRGRSGSRRSGRTGRGTARSAACRRGRCGSRRRAARRRPTARRRGAARRSSTRRACSGAAR